MAVVSCCFQQLKWEVALESEESEIKWKTSERRVSEWESVRVRENELQNEWMNKWRRIDEIVRETEFENKQQHNLLLIYS